MPNPRVVLKRVVEELIPVEKTSSRIEGQHPWIAIAAIGRICIAEVVKGGLAAKNFRRQFSEHHRWRAVQPMMRVNGFEERPGLNRDGAKAAEPDFTGEDSAGNLDKKGRAEGTSDRQAGDASSWDEGR